MGIVSARGSGTTPALAPRLTWRFARPEDGPALETLRAASGAYPRDGLEWPDWRVLLAPDASQRVAILCGLDIRARMVAFAAAVAYRSGDQWRCDLLVVVHPEVRGRGLGTLLAAWAEAAAGRLLVGICP